MDPARLRKIPVFSDFHDEELRHVAALERSQRNATVVATSPMLLVTLSGWDVPRLRKSAPSAVEQLRDVVAERREHA